MWLLRNLLSSAQGPVVAILLLLCPFGAVAGELLIAVASNFDQPMAQLAANFERASGHTVRRSAGSTGKLYAQIVNGAPYDLFFAADTERPQRLLANGQAMAGSALAYAEGVLALWSAQPGNGDCRERLAAGEFGYFAIANPALAPYGAAARDWLRGEGVWDAVQGKLVFGESIGQAFHYVASGNAAMGLVAAAQLSRDERGGSGCVYLIPAGSHRPIVQQAVILSTARNPSVAALFMQFIRTEAAAAIIADHGYRRPRDAS